MAFGFVKGAAQKAGKKMYGYGQRGAQVVKDNPGAGIAAAGVGGAIGLTQAGVLEADWDGSKQLSYQEVNSKLRNYFGSGTHEKWLSQSFDPETDYNHLRGIANLLHVSNPEGFQQAYEGLLAQASKRKGSPSMEELHEIIKDMKGVGI